MLRIIERGDQLKSSRYKLHSKFNNVINYHTDDKCSFLSVVRSDIGGGPYNLIVSDLSLLKDEIILEDENFIVGQDIFSLVDVPIFYSKIDFTMPTLLDKNIEIFFDLLMEVKNQSLFLKPLSNENTFSTIEDHLIKRLDEGRVFLFSNKMLRGVRMLKGLGVGLTPSGDDFLSGVMLGIHLLGITTRQNEQSKDRILSTILKNSLGQNMLSNWLLKASSQGFVTKKMKQFLSCLLYENCEFSYKSFKTAFLNQTKIGYSSGIDQMCGLFEVIKRKHQWS